MIFKRLWRPLPSYGYAKIAEKIRKSLTLTDHPAKNAAEAYLAQLPANAFR